MSSGNGFVFRVELMIYKNFRGGLCTLVSADVSGLHFAVKRNFGLKQFLTCDGMLAWHMLSPSVCLSICVSQVGVLSYQLNIGSRKQRHGTSFQTPKILTKFHQRGYTQRGGWLCRSDGIIIHCKQYILYRYQLSNNTRLPYTNSHEIQANSSCISWELVEITRDVGLCVLVKRDIMTSCIQCSNYGGPGPLSSGSAPHPHYRLALRARHKAPLKTFW